MLFFLVGVTYDRTHTLLWTLFFGSNNSGLIIEEYLGDAKPREITIAACLLIPIIGIGIYPKVATQTYDLQYRRGFNRLTSWSDKRPLK